MLIMLARPPNKNQRKPDAIGDWSMLAKLLQVLFGKDLEDYSDRNKNNL